MSLLAGLAVFARVPAWEGDRARGLRLPMASLLFFSWAPNIAEGVLRPRGLDPVPWYWILACVQASMLVGLAVVLLVRRPAAAERLATGLGWSQERVAAGLRGTWTRDYLMSLLVLGLVAGTLVWPGTGALVNLVPWCLLVAWLADAWHTARATRDARDWACVSEPQNPLDASGRVHRLREAGLGPVLVGERVAALGHPFLPAMPMRVFVREEDAETALQFLDQSTAPEA